ncbi:MAG: hypothetical protein QOF51_3609, partial [Chloroflexota bacterium]|nr:hypothetical protein [Chloroflexota bacterium]
MTTVFDGLQEFIDAAIEADPNYTVIEGADWNEEIGALLEVVAENIPNPPMIIFDKVKGYPPGYRIAANVTAGRIRSALAFGIDVEGKTPEELARLTRERTRNVTPIPPEWVENGPIMDNVLTGAAVDVFKFPVPRYHAADGGRYIGTHDCIINKDPESGYVNVGTYRVEAHEKDLLGLWMSPGQQGRIICQRYWDRGEACPVVATFGEDPLMFMAGHTRLPYGQSELDYAGGLRQKAVPVIKGPVTGLPIPAWAEIAIEGEIPPPWVEARDEGPFGEWPGYYSGGTIGTGEQQPVIRIKALYHRNNPMLGGGAPMWPGAYAGDRRGQDGGRAGSADLERAGVSHVVNTGGHMGYIRAIAIEQQYPGHAKQVAHAALANTRNGRWIVILDEDVDPSNLKEVIWAMTTRCDPKTDIEVVDGVWGTPLDPLVSVNKEKKES